MRAALAIVACCLCTRHAYGLSNDSVVTVIQPHGAGLPQTVLERAARAYEAETGFKVDVQYMRWGELGTLLNENYTDAAMVTADVVTIGSTVAPHMYDKGVLAPLGDYYEEWRRSRGRLGSVERDFVRNLDYTYSFPPDRQDLSQPPEWHAVPLDVGTSVFFYRKDLFAKWLRHENPPRTIDEALAYGRVIRAGELSEGRDVAGWAVPTDGMGSSAVMQIFLTYVVGNGSSFVGAGGECGFEDEFFAGPLRTYTDMYGSQHGLVFNSTDDLTQHFAEGKVAMMGGAMWNVWGLTAGGIPRTDIGVTNVPAGPVGPYTFQGGSGWAIPSQVPEARTADGKVSISAAENKRKRAFDFVAYLSDPTRPYVKDLTYASGLLPAYESAIRAGKQTAADGVQLDEITLYEAETEAPIPTRPEWFSGGAGADATNVTHEHSVRNLATGVNGDWIEYNTVGSPTVTITLPEPMNLSHHTVTTGGFDPVGFERDPFAWKVYVSETAASEWRYLGEFGQMSWAVPLDRGQVGSKLPLYWGVTKVRAQRVKFAFTQTRGPLCTDACAATVEQLPFAVPLQYPQQGFFKMGRLEANRTVDRMLHRLHLGEDIKTVTAQACREWEEIMYDAPLVAPPEPKTNLGVVVGPIVGVLVLCVIAFFVYSRLSQKEISRLKNLNEMAEDIADAVAVMDLEACEYLFALEKPNRIQNAFVNIITLLKEYRTYLPENLKHNGDSETASDPDMTCDGQSGVASRTNHSRISASRASSIQSSLHSLHLRKERALEALQLNLVQKRVTVLAVNCVGWLKSVAQVPIPTVLSDYSLYITTVTEIVQKSGGVVDMMSGDRLLVTYNAVKQCSEQVTRALTVPFSTPRDIRLSFGCSHGVCRVGNMGNDRSRHFTIVGADIAHAVKLEEYGKQRQLLCVVDHSVFDILNGRYTFRVVGGVLHAKKSPIVIIAAAVLEQITAASDEWMYQLENAATMNVHAEFNNFATSICNNAFRATAQSPPEHPADAACEIMAGFRDGVYRPVNLDLAFTRVPRQTEAAEVGEP